METLVHFKVGDRVTWCGVKGTVTKDYKFRSDQAASLEVEFEHVVNEAFGTRKVTEKFGYDGKLMPWHKEASLKLETK